MENMGQLKVSVLMLTYNRENLIERAIKSVLKQTFKDFEFIVIDNGSEDRSGKIADAYANTDKRRLRSAVEGIRHWMLLEGNILHLLMMMIG